MSGICGDPTRLRIVSWNIGLRGLQRTLNVVADGKLEKLCRMLQADMLCLQEVKSTRADLTQEIALADGHTSFFSCNRAFTQYSGVATIVADHVGTISMQEGLTGILAGATDSDAAAAARVTVSSETRASAAGSFSYTNNDAEDVSSGGRTYSNLELDSEGRCIITDHGAFVLVNVYAPAASSDGDRLSFKWQYHEALRRKVRQLLLSGVHVIVAGDLNVSHTQLDHCDPQEWIKHSHGRAFESGVFRRWMTAMLDGSDVLPTIGGLGVVSFAPVEALPRPGASSQLLASALLTAQCNQMLRLVDSFRTLHPTAEGAFTCWNQVTASRATNYGTRIDYILLDAGVRIGDGEFPQSSSSSSASSSASPSSSADEAADAVRLLEADVQQQFQGSDHCPVSVVLSVPLHLLTARRIDNTVGTSAASSSVALTAAQHTAVHPQSVNAYPEFNKRQKRLSSFFSKQTEHAAAAVAPDDSILSALGTVASSSEPARSVASIAAGAAQTEAGLKRSISDSAAGAAAASKNKKAKPAVATATLHSFLKPAPVAVQSHASSKRKEPAASEADDSDVVVIDSSQDDAGTRTGTAKPAAERSPALLPMAASAASQPATSSSSSSSTNHLKPASSTSSSSSTPAPAPSTAWASLLSGPVPAPMCACGVVTVERQSKQVNENLGRRFYVCPRPQGKTGDPNARCDFFLWADVHRQRVVQAAAGYRGNSAGAGAGSSSASSSSTTFR